jgi:ABC-type bacteriocin/lantibiotic exporter with double-glycine peptidase domain
MRLEVAPLRQTLPQTCLPACLCMVLEYLGRKHSEEELARICGTRRIGTRPTDAVEGLENLGYDCALARGIGLDELSSYLLDDRPVIAFLRLEDYSANVAGAHAVVVTGVSDEEVVFVDPLSGGEHVLLVREFLAIWSRRGGEGLIVFDV